MDTNACGMPIQDLMDHANPAAARELAEAVDEKLFTHISALHDARWVDAFAMRQSANFGVTAGGFENTFYYDTVVFCTWDQSMSNPRSGKWLIMCTMTIGLLSGTVNYARSFLRVNDAPGPLADIKTTTLESTSYNNPRAEVNHCITGIVDVQYPDMDIVLGCQLGGTGGGTILASSNWLCGVRLGD